MAEQQLVERKGAAMRLRRWWPFAAVILLGFVVFVLIWFQPQKLFIDDRVDESAPVAEQEARVLARGEFVSLDHRTMGSATVLDLGGDRRVVRLEGLDTSNGPALRLHLTANPATGAEKAFDDDFVDLGPLKGDQGDQNYDIALQVDLRHYDTVLVWCDRFDSAFGAADLRTV